MAYLLLILPLALEVTSIFAILSFGAPWRWPVFLLSHGAASAAWGYLLARVFIRCERQPQPSRTPRRLCCFFAVLTFFIPYFGVLGILFAFACAIHGLPTKPTCRYVVTRPRELPRNASIASSAAYSAGGLVDIVRHAKHPSSRTKAILATRGLSDREAVPILRAALADVADDVRLTAYALLDQRENKHLRELQRFSKQLQEAASPGQQRLLGLLAEKNWELSYFGWVQGDVERQVLEKASSYARAALEKDANAPAMRCLLGRIRLAQGEPVQARQQFALAAASGFPATRLRPFVAESYFAERNFAALRKALGECSALTLQTTPMREVAALWS